MPEVHTIQAEIWDACVVQRPDSTYAQVSESYCCALTLLAINGSKDRPYVCRVFGRFTVTSQSERLVFVQAPSTRSRFSSQKCCSCTPRKTLKIIVIHKQMGFAFFFFATLVGCLLALLEEGAPSEMKTWAQDYRPPLPSAYSVGWAVRHPIPWSSVAIDWSLKVYTQLAREGVVLTQDGDTELSLVFIQPSSDSSW